MRRALLLGLPIVALLVAAGGLYLYLHRPDLLKDAALSSSRGDLRRAELDLDSYLRGHPDSAEASFRLGRIRLAQGNLVAADRLLRRARAGGYDPAQILMPLGEVYLQQRRYDDLLTDFTVEKAPPASKADVLALRASAFLGLHQADQAKESAAQAIQAAPNATDPVIVAARVDAAAGDMPAAEARIDALLRHNPNQPEAALMKIDLLLHRNDLKDALAAAQSLLAANPGSPAAEMAEARVLAGMNRDVEATRLVDDVLRRIPKDIGANYMKLRLADRQKDFVAADASLEILLPMLDRLPQGQYFAAMTKLGVNQPAQAQEAATKYVAQNPKDLAGIKMLAFSELALNRGDRVLAVLKPVMESGHPDADTLDLEARAMAMRGDLKGAEQMLARASAGQPGNTEILNRLGAAKVELGDTAAGEADLRRSLAQSPDQPKAAAALVQTALTTGDTRSAAQTVAALRKAVGDSEEAGVLDGQVKIAQMDLAGAEAVLTDTLKRFPDSRQATLGLVQVEGRLGNTKTARERLLGWMNTHPDDKAGLKLLVTSDMAGRDKPAAIAALEAAHGAAPADLDVDAALAELYLSAKMPQKAVDLIDRSASNGTETNPALLPLKGQALIDEGRLSEAQDVLKQAATAMPTNTQARFGLIELKMRQKDFDGARAVAQDGLRAMPGNQRLMEALVAIDLKANGIKAALQTASVLKQDPKNMPAAVTLGPNALAVSGDKQGAANAFLAAFHEVPSPQMALAAATALNRAGRAPEAQALLQAWAAQHPDDAGPQGVLASYAIGARHYPEAGDRLAHVLAAHPSDASALNNLAWVKLMTGDAAAALPLAQRAYYLAPTAETEDTLGWIMTEQGDSAGGLKLLQQAASVKPTQQILYHYAVALDGQGRKLDARQALEKALGDKAPFEGRPDAEKLRRGLP